jgi:hypothetical protein
MIFVAESAEHPARKIKVFINTDINQAWLQFLKIDNLNLKIIKPKDAGDIIQQAVNPGWNPSEKGKPLAFDYDRNGCIKTRKA